MYKNINRIITAGLLILGSIVNLQAQGYPCREENQFEIVFPGEYVHNTMPVQTEIGEVEMHLFQYESEGSSYILAYSDMFSEEMTAGFDSTMISDILNGTMDGFAGELDMIVDESWEFEYSERPGLYFSASSELYDATGYVLLDGGRLYQIVYMGEYEGVMNEDFFNSFVFLQ